MRMEIRIFLILLLLNTLAVIGYIIWNRAKRREKKRGYLIRSLVMFLCPVVGILYFFFGWVFQRVFFHKPVNLVDVLFSKDRETILLKAEEDKERNLAPIEDALSVTDKASARELLLEVIKRHSKESLRSISVALKSDDSELAHYAASVLQSELDRVRREIYGTSERVFSLDRDIEAFEQENGEIKTEAGRRFRKQILSWSGEDLPEETEDQKELKKKKLVYADIAPELEASSDFERHASLAEQQGLLAKYGEVEEDKTLFEELKDEMHAAHELIDEIDGLLRQGLNSEYEKKQFTDILHEISLIVEKRDVLRADEIAANVIHNIRAKEYERAKEWNEKSFYYYPEALSSYSSKLKLQYDMGDRDGFFETVETMKQSDIPFDHEMIELVRYLA